MRVAYRKHYAVGADLKSLTKITVIQIPQGLGSVYEPTSKSRNTFDAHRWHNERSAREEVSDSIHTNRPGARVSLNGRRILKGSHFGSSPGVQGVRCGATEVRGGKRILRKQRKTLGKGSPIGNGCLRLRQCRISGNADGHGDNFPAPRSLAIRVRDGPSENDRIE